MEPVFFRQIPEHLMNGYFSGQYKVYGGVLRHAYGSQAGQIVAHLIPTTASDLASIPMLGPVNAPTMVLRQLNDMQALSQGLYQLASGSMMLARLNFSVTLVGFALLRDRIVRVDEGLKELNRSNKKLLAITQRQEFGKLANALDDLARLERISNADNRARILHDSRQALGQLQQGYRHALQDDENTTEEVLSFEELFVLTAVSQARCSAELGEMSLAQHELEDAYGYWLEASRFITANYLFAESPARFLLPDYADTVPTQELVEWMTYMTGEDLGYEHLDNLRRGATNSGSLMSRIPKNLNELTSNRKKDDEQIIIPAIRKLHARSSVLESHVDQYRLLASNNLILADLQAYIDDETESEYVVLLNP